MEATQHSQSYVYNNTQTKVISACKHNQRLMKQQNIAKGYGRNKKLPKVLAVTKHCQKVMEVPKYDQILWNQQNIANIMETAKH